MTGRSNPSAKTFCRVFTHPTPRVPPEKFTRFVQTELPVMVEKLMQGSFTSLRILHGEEETQPKSEPHDKIHTDGKGRKFKLSCDGAVCRKIYI